ncbi:MAG: XTP/dITP diphosphatase [Crenarchaeota archaeon]|nr:XTP/dITP diphosphatase [Thermoproteota archaeon]
MISKSKHIIFFATGNVHKFNEVRALLSEHGIAVAMLKAKGTEIQSDSIVDIAKTSVVSAFEKYKLPLLVEDAGLFIDALNGFPGPYAAFAFKTIGNTGILKLLENVKNRQAAFKSAISYYDYETKSALSFEGQIIGKISLNEKAKDSESVFGFDPIFIPNGSDKTFAQMSLEEKNKYSHRAIAISKFVQWYKS